MKETLLEKRKEHKGVLKLSFGDTRPGIYNTSFAVIIPKVPICARHSTN